MIFPKEREYDRKPRKYQENKPINSQLDTTNPFFYLSHADSKHSFGTKHQKAKIFLTGKRKIGEKEKRIQEWQNKLFSLPLSHFSVEIFDFI